MHDLDDASSALKVHRETLENATSETEAQHHYHNDSQWLLLHLIWLIVFRTTCTSNIHPTPF